MSLMDTGGGIDTGGLGGIFSMQYLPAAMIAFSSGLKAIGSWGQGDAIVQGAQRRQQAAEFEAQQLMINAGQARAAAQRDAHFKNLEGEQLISAIRARAGSGGSDPTVLNIIGQAMARQAYNASAAIYGGDEKARLMTMQAQGKRYDAALGLADAKSARSSYRLGAVGALAEGAAGLYEKYWPKNAETPAAPSGGFADYEDGASPVYMAQGPVNTTGIRG